MKKILLLILFLLPATGFAAVHVNGYFRSNGTYVAPHYRSNPDGNPYNNYSFPGNTNPYTGVTAGGDVSTYLNNYYKNSYSTNNYSSYLYTTPTPVPTPTPTPLPVRNVAYTAQLWADSYPNANCNNSTFLRQNERLECSYYRMFKNSSQWNITTNEFDGWHYVYDPITKETHSCRDGYKFPSFNNAGGGTKCEPEMKN